MDNRIDLEKLLIFIPLFTLFTAIGTLSHEWGHVAVAKILGYKTFLHYSSMHYNNLSFSKTKIEHRTAIKQNLQLHNQVKKINPDNLLIIIGGPLQTIFTGTIGVATILWRQGKMRRFGLQPLDWLAVFLSLFWLREVFNLAVSIGSELLMPNESYFSGDEKNISKLLHLSPGTFPIILGAIGLAISAFTILKIVSRKLRLTFILGGLVGGISGFILWMCSIGPEILP